MNKRDWTITFDDNSTAHYCNMTSLEAVRLAVSDWYPAKRVIAWEPNTELVFSVPLRHHGH
jgi:hypothetical protein